MKSPLDRIGFRSSYSFLLLSALLAFAPEVAAQAPPTPDDTAEEDESASALPPAPPPVAAAGGSTVTLPRSGLTIVLPPSSGNWQISVSPGNDRADLLRSLGGGSNPRVEIELNLMANLTCRAMMDLVMTLKTLPGTQVVQKPTYLPADFQAFGALEIPVHGRPGVSACSETPRGALMARVWHDGASIHSIDRTTVGAILTAASRAAGAPELAPVPDPPPTLVRLPVSGLEVELPTADTAWNIGSRTLNDGYVVDFIERTSPKKPFLAVKLMFLRDRTKVCKRADTLVPSEGVVVNLPSYLTHEWSPAVIEEDKGSNVHVARICGELSEGGVAFVEIIYSASLRDRDLNDVRPILSTLARAAGVSRRSTDSGYRASSSSSYSGSRGGSSSSYADDDEGPSLSRWEIGAFQLSPDDSTLDKSLGALVGVDLLSANPDKVVSFALQGAVEIGFDSTSNIPFDGRGSIGLGLSLGPVFLVPLVGAGLDTAGGGDGNSYRIPLAWYWDVEGRVRLAINDELGLDASALRAKRGNGPPDEETRLSAHVSKSFDGGDTFWALGLRYVNYGDAKLIGASFGSTL